MDSTTFRRDYAKLTEPTDVTVNGHAIGRWYPAVHLKANETYYVGESVIRDDAGAKVGTVPVVAPTERFNTRPFTPVPRKRDK